MFTLRYDLRNFPTAVRLGTTSSKTGSAVTHDDFLAINNRTVHLALQTKTLDSRHDVSLTGVLYELFGQKSLNIDILPPPRDGEIDFICLQHLWTTTKPAYCVPSLSKIDRLDVLLFVELSHNYHYTTRSITLFLLF